MTGSASNTRRQLVLRNRRAYRKRSRLKQNPVDLAIRRLGLMNLSECGTEVSNLCINNMTDEIIPEDVLKTLGLGLKFIPTPKISLDGIHDAIQKYIRNITLRETFGTSDTPNYMLTKLNPSSIYTPFVQNTRLRSIIDEIRNNTALHLNHEETTNWDDKPMPLKKVRWSIDPVFHSYDDLPKTRSNIKLKTLQSTISLLKDPRFIIKPADKNLGLTIMYDSWYCKEVMRQLSDSATYYDLGSIIGYNARLYNIRKQLRLGPKFRFIHKNAIKLLEEDKEKVETVPEFYILPKLHKNPVLGRPIVPSHSWITSNASRILNLYLQPILAEYNQILNNSTRLIIQLEALDPTITYDIVTGDVSSLYTNIPTNDGIKAVGSIISDYYKNSPGLVHELKWLLDWVLKGNVFKFRTKYYYQLNGTAMGTSCAPAYANLYMAYLEKNLNTSNSILWYRYIDDIILIYDKKTPGLVNLMNQYNTQNKNIVINWDQSRDTAFLDLLIRQESDGKIRISTYNKETNKFLYIPYTSFHPRSQKQAFIRTELIRFLRTNNSKLGFVERKTLFFHHLTARGYPPVFLIPLFRKVKWEMRSKFLTSKSKNFGPINRARNHPKPNFNKQLELLFGTEYVGAARMNLVLTNNPSLRYINWDVILQTYALKEEGFIREKPRLVKKSASSILDYVNKTNKIKSINNPIVKEEEKMKPQDAIIDLPKDTTSNRRYESIDLTDKTEESQPSKKSRNI